MPESRLKPFSFALACLFSAAAQSEPVGLKKFEVDPALVAPALVKRAPVAETPRFAPQSATAAENRSSVPRPQPSPQAVAQIPPAPAPQRIEETPVPAAGPTAAAPVEPSQVGTAPAAAAPGIFAPAEPPRLGTPLEMELEAIRAGGPITLKFQPAFLPFPENQKDPLPAFISAERLQGVADKQVEAAGEAELRKRGQRVFADRMTYLPENDEVHAEGRVRIEQRGDVLEGPTLRLNFDTARGSMEQPWFHLAESGGRGGGERLLFEGEKKYRLQETSYTTCPCGQDDWYLKVSDLEVDKNRQVGTARNAAVWFKGVPVLYTPWMDFSLSKARKSGFLAPVFGSTAEGGAEITLPYYWNIAPNRDATIAPRVMTKRGLMLNNEFRYLEPLYSGEVHVDFLPDDRLTGRNRYALSLAHAQNLTRGFSGALNLQKVSDDAYFRDLSNNLTVTSQTNLQRTGTLGYGGTWWNGAPWSASALVQRWQTLQDPKAPVIPPYSRTPQLALAASKLGVYGADLNLYGTFADFRHPSLSNGRRTVFYPSVSYPLQTAFAYVTPKFGLHYTRYSLDPATTTLTDASRTTPIFSLDTGMVFERDWGFGKEQFLQTLEPRIYYVYIPFRDQNGLPNFDSGETDFSFAQIFTENRFSGEDRINDANQVTLAITSRLLEPDSGNERLRLTLGQRLNLSSQRVFLIAPTSTRTRSDFLAALTGRLTSSWLLDAGLQYDPEDGRNEKISFNARYQPEPHKVANFGYRFNRESNVEQVDGAAQWPLGGRWFGVARLNYSLRESKILEGLAGLEYNAGCWALRLVTQRFVTATQETANAFFVQLELNGLTNIGANPLELLRQSIPGYTKINEPTPVERPFLTELSPGKSLCR